MINENEDVITSQNDELDGQEPEIDSSEDVNALKQKYDELAVKNRQLFERAKKAEGFDRVDGKWVKTQKPESETPPLPTPQSNEPDYAKLAFLETKGIAHPDDQKLVQDEALRLKLPLTDILGMDHIKSKLETAKDQREAMAGMPKGRGTSGGKTQQDVEFWADQKNPDGSYKTPDDQELAEKVIDARMKKETNSNKFSDELYTG